jgi:polyphosphate kinase
MSAAPVLVSVGDHGVLNREIAQPLAELWIDRDLSWLDFNDRALAEALDERTPLLERLKFWRSHLDPGRVLHEADLGTEGAARAGTRQIARNHQLPAARKPAPAGDVFRRTACSATGRQGIHLRQWDELTPAQREEADAYFDNQISAALTPLIFDLAHPFPFLSTCLHRSPLRFTIPVRGPLPTRA